MVNDTHPTDRLVTGLEALARSLRAASPHTAATPTATSPSASAPEPTPEPPAQPQELDRYGITLSDLDRYLPDTDPEPGEDNPNSNLPGRTASPLAATSVDLDELDAAVAQFSPLEDKEPARRLWGRRSDEYKGRHLRRTAPNGRQLAIAIGGFLLASAVGAAGAAMTNPASAAKTDERPPAVTIQGTIPAEVEAGDTLIIVDGTDRLTVAVETVDLDD